MGKVAFITKCWGGDYHKFLRGEFERKRPPYNFHKEILLLNNGVPLEFKSSLYQIRVDELANDVLEYFNLNKKSFLRDGYDGYNYSIAELTALYLARDCDYLCWVQGDCSIEGDWVTPAIKILQETDCVVVSPSSAVNTWHDSDNVDHFFSDQAFVIRPKDFKEFNLIEPVLKEYPYYGGASFEYKMGQYLHKTGKFRKILNDFYCVH